ncbi:hypothetical protein [Flagellimonas zhangzhouensis]|uniref:Uncharacterized protein n=1 Tax=Flagellimonas zhangzhouensis TaxID=1073328 RepID=A0A1H2SGD9_9FLAO|nr:hypothetical protein [Allomuricauda zhangzhouensis]SDQ74391.1 hypothetical protein SAMN05216294_2435 [Allomuricauda zhangzhouensis]SDW30575.1 hypothetical protein SAMN04487892_1080 [Allomuricauda zhangzhouensis]
MVNFKKFNVLKPIKITMSNAIPNNTAREQELLVRVQRNYTLVERLFEKLKSYKYEPKCPLGFEKLYELKRNFRLFENNQSKIIHLFEEDEHGITSLSEKEIQKHLERFKQLENEYTSYIIEMCGRSKTEALNNLYQ